MTGVQTCALPICTGFRWVALLVAVIFVVTEAICCASVKETGSAEIKTATVGEMFKALFSNDQALVVVGKIGRASCRERV